MSDFMDYISWRGDLTFEQSALNEVDSAMFSYMVYVDFSGIVSESDSPISLKEASDKFWALHTEQEILDKPTLTKMSAFVLREMASSRRFADLKLFAYVDETSEEEQKQFAAMQIELDAEHIYLVYRGTDETIVGWREDFNMVYLPEVPSEKRAFEYLRDTLENPVNSTKRYYVGGHSKGGHLAMYGAVRNAQLHDSRIAAVFNFDGPGLSDTMVKSEAYQKIRPRIISYLPEQSFFGLMLCHEEVIYGVRSSKSALLQHDPLSWQILGNSFLKCGITPQALGLNEALKAWLFDLTLEERYLVIDCIFDSLAEADIRTIGDLADLNPAKIYELVRGLKRMEPEEKNLIGKCFKNLVRELKQKGHDSEMLKLK